MSSKIEKGDMVEVVENVQGGLTKPSLAKHSKYVANDTLKCSKCGTVALDIGLRALTPPPHTTTCYCGTPFPNPNSSPLYDAVFFRKIEPDYKLVEIETSVREELKKFNVTEKIDA